VTGYWIAGAGMIAWGESEGLGIRLDHIELPPHRNQKMVIDDHGGMRPMAMRPNTKLVPVKSNRWKDSRANGQKAKRKSIGDINSVCPTRHSSGEFNSHSVSSVGSGTNATGSVLPVSSLVLVQTRD
jgi:hypothetical protein